MAVTHNHRNKIRIVGAKRAHETTVTSMETAKIERRLISHLSQVYSEVKRDIVVTVGVSFAAIRLMQEQKVSDEIRSAITEIYIIASRYVTGAADLTFFITDLDIQKISSMSQFFIDWFWQGLEREIVKKTSSAFDPKTLMRLSDVPNMLTDTFVTRMAASLASQTLSEATLHKITQIAPRLQTENKYLFAAYQVSKKMAALYSAQKSRMVWSTALDEKVCEICAPMEGDVFDFDDAQMPIPVQDSHINCRCRLLLVDNEGNVVLG